MIKNFKKSTLRKNKNNKMKLSNIKYFPITILIILLLSCNPDNFKKTNIESDTIDLSDESLNINTKKVTKIFYNVPSPIEMASLMQRAGVYYDPNILNSTKNTSKYLNNSEQALNLGVYGADLSYTRIFDQIQESMNYLTAIKKISDQLGIPRQEGAFTVNKIEENIDNKDSLLIIISNTYSNTDLYLKENNRGNIAAKIILGGWIEALYVAVNVVNEKKPNNEIMLRIAEQKYSLDNLIELLNEYKQDKDIQHYLVAIKELKTVFDQIEIDYEEGQAITTDKDTKTTTINSQAKINVSINNIKAIKSVVSKIRSEIVK